MSGRDPLRMSTAAIQVVETSKLVFRMRALQIGGLVVVVLTYALIKWLEKLLDLDLDVVTVALTAFIATFTGKPANAVTEGAAVSLPNERLERVVQSLPPRRLEEIYRRVGIERSAISLEELRRQSAETPTKDQPHHRPRTPR